MTPISRLAMARMISAVTVIFGTAESTRSMGDDTWRGNGACEEAEASLAAAAANSDLETFDLVPQRAVLVLVGRPYFLLRDFPEFIDLGFHHGHAERLQLRFGLGEIVDQLGCFANLGLCCARQIDHELLVLG